MKRFLGWVCACAAMAACVLAIAGCSPSYELAEKLDTMRMTGEAQLTTKASLTTGIAESLSNSIPYSTEPASGSATVLVYMNGSDLESQYGEATSDITEMLGSGIGKNANVVIETLGTSNWQRYGIASNRSQRYIVKDYELQLVDDSLGQLDSTAPGTLSDFIRWGVKNYPADRYFLIMWDHGAGPVWGFGYDEFQGDYASLTLNEIQSALKANSNVHFDFIGMDCCLMSSMETCCVLAPFCDYAILSEDFEPGMGWYYRDWMSDLEVNPTIKTTELGKTIVDTMVKESLSYGGATLALIDESVAPLLYSTWVAFAYENENALLGTNYSQETVQRGKAPGNGWGNWNGGGYNWGDGHGSWSSGYDEWMSLLGYWGSDNSNVTMADYHVTDIMAVASSIKSDKAKALEAAVGNAIVCYNCTSDETGMTGIGVTLPYGDAEFYDELVEVFTACGFDKSYIRWLEEFVGASGTNNPYDYGQFDRDWSGWDYWNDNYDWQSWAWGNNSSWDTYENSGWYDPWYSDQGSQGNTQSSGWSYYFLDTLIDMLW